MTHQLLITCYYPPEGLARPSEGKLRRSEEYGSEDPRPGAVWEGRRREGEEGGRGEEVEPEETLLHQPPPLPSLR